MRVPEHRTEHRPLETENASIVSDEPRAHLLRATATALVILAAIALAGSGLWRCPTAVLFGIPCPTCGATRTVHAILALDLEGVLRFNPLAPIGIVLFAASAVRAVVLAYREGHLRRIDEGRIGRALLLGWLIFWTVATIYWALRFFGLFGGPCPV